MVLSQDLQGAFVSPGTTRVYKSHMSYNSCMAFKNGEANICKKIYCYRDLKEVIVSALHFALHGIMGLEDASLEALSASFLIFGGVDSSLNDLVDWWEHTQAERG